MGLHRDASHLYYVSGLLDDDHFVEVGPLLSVTTGLKSMDKPFIPRWAARVTAERAVYSHSEIGKMIADGGEASTIEWLKGVPWHKRDKAADTGTDFHMLAEAIGNGQPITEESEQNGRVKQFRLFEAEFNPQPIMHPSGFRMGVEQMVVNFSERYAGTADRFTYMSVPHPDGPNPKAPYVDGTIPAEPELWVLDYKTSDLDKNGPYDEHCLQLAGLNGAEWWGWPDREMLEPALHATRAGILQVAEDHFNLWELAIGEPEYTAFLHVIRSYEWMQSQHCKIGKAKRGAK